MQKGSKNLKVRSSSDLTYWMKNVNSKTTVILLHGIGSSSSFATKIGKEHTNFNVISLDMPGGINGPIFPGLTVQFIAEKVSHFIKHHVKSKNIVLVGHSLGAAVAAHVASENKKVDGVVYVSPFTPNLVLSKSYKAANAYMSLGDSKIDITKKTILGGAIKTAAKAFGFKNLNAFTDEKSNEYSLLKNNVYNEDYISKELLDAYKNVSKPCMFIISAKDIVVSTEGVTKFANRLRKKIVIIDSADHNPFKHSAKEVVDILNDKIKFEKRVFGRKIIEL